MRGSGTIRVLLAVVALAAMFAMAGCIIRTSGGAHVSSGPSVVTAAPVAAGAGAQGTISYPGQRVRYPLSISYPRTVQIYVDGHGLDPTVSVYDPYGNRIGFNDDGGSGLDSLLVLTLNPGNYIVEVAGYGSSTGPFTMSIN